MIQVNPQNTDTCPYERHRREDTEEKVKRQSPRDQERKAQISPGETRSCDPGLWGDSGSPEEAER